MIKATSQYLNRPLRTICEAFYDYLHFKPVSPKHTDLYLDTMKNLRPALRLVKTFNPPI